MKKNAKAVIILVVLTIVIIIGSVLLYKYGSPSGFVDAVSHSTSK